MNARIAGMVPLIASGLILLSPDAISARTPDEPITITPSDFNLSREKLMESVATLEIMTSSGIATADYARRFKKLQDDLARAKPPFSQWNSDERERITELPEPTEAAWQALRTEDAAVQAKLDARAREAQQQYENRAEEQRLRNQAQNAQDRLDALRQAQIDEAEARRDFYEDSFPAFYYTPWLGGGHGHHHGRPPNKLYPAQNLYYGTRPTLPNNYTPNPIKP